MSKSEREIAIFKQFLESRGLGAQVGLVDSRCPPEPDILFDGVAFELAEICSEDLAKAMATTAKSGEAEFTYCGDPTLTILVNKSNKCYVTPHPIELLVYTDGRVVSPDNMIIPKIAQSAIPLKKNFRRIWFLGRKAPYLVCNFTQE